MKQLEKLQQQGYIEQTNSLLGAGILFASKKDGGQRLCVDYRDLDKQTIKDRYPLPRVDAILDGMTRSKWFTKLDLHSGFHQVRMYAPDVHKTAFNTSHGSFAWKVMPFGLTNAPSTFQRMMDQVLKELVRTGGVSVFIDDIIVFTPGDESEHMVRVMAVLEQLQKSGLFCKWAKCGFLLRETDFCGFMVGRDGVKVMKNKIDQVMDWPGCDVPRAH